ncbi:hypothetical protein BDZ91DRAFT_719995 [Kalaharituber pfeilii]|nr:hypothetical protein BDZ91DRAFT_719995 [Kalaharituber pfeilii]
MPLCKSPQLTRRPNSPPRASVSRTDPTPKPLSPYKLHSGALSSVIYTSSFSLDFLTSCT